MSLTIMIYVSTYIYTNKIFYNTNYWCEKFLLVLIQKMLEIQFFLQKLLQTTDVVSDYWQIKKIMLLVGPNENQ